MLMLLPSRPQFENHGSTPTVLQHLNTVVSMLAEPWGGPHLTPSLI